MEIKALKNCITLSSNVRIYVPSTVNVNEHMDTREHVNRTLSFLSLLFGGSTASKALGAWVTATGKLIKESVTIVFAYATQEKLEDEIEKVYEFCLSLKNELKQESIALEVNGVLYLI